MNLQGMIDLQLMMFLEIGIGWFLRRKNLITEEGKKVLTDLVIDLILPCNIVQSFLIKMDKDILMRGFQILVISVILQMFCTLISATCYNRIEKGKRTVLQYATVCSNAGFLGNPVAEGLFGSIGLLYASVYLIPQRIVMWSAGVSYFTESPSKKEVAKKVLTHPCIIAVEIGLALMGLMSLGVTLPSFATRTLGSISSSTTPVTMLLIGAIMASADMKTMVTKITVIFSVIRLVLIPLAVFVGCLVFRVDATVAGVSVILAAMPAGSTTAILASRYHKDEEFASKCVVLTTVLSMLAIPGWSMVLLTCL